MGNDIDSAKLFLHIVLCSTALIFLQIFSGLHYKFNRSWCLQNAPSIFKMCLGHNFQCFSYLFCNASIGLLNKSHFICVRFSKEFMHSDYTGNIVYFLTELFPGNLFDLLISSLYSVSYFLYISYFPDYLAFINPSWFVCQDYSQWTMRFFAFLFPFWRFQGLKQFWYYCLLLRILLIVDIGKKKTFRLPQIPSNYCFFYWCY